jgi:hypothetical protein
MEKLCSMDELGGYVVKEDGRAAMTKHCPNGLSAGQVRLATSISFISLSYIHVGATKHNLAEAAAGGSISRGVDGRGLTSG